MGLRESEEAAVLLREAIEELEDPKGRVATAIRKIRRAASLVNRSDLVRWCRVQLGDYSLLLPIQEFVKTFRLAKEENGGRVVEVGQEAVKKLKEAGIRFGKDITVGEISVKMDQAGGGWQDIEYIEGMRDTLMRLKQGSSGEYYLGNLSNTIAYVRSEAHARAVALYHKLEFADSALTAFDVLKEAVDDKLVSLAPELGEKLMLAFEQVSADREKERWAQGLTSCRRLLKELADRLYSPREGTVKGRKLGEEQYINRLWAFMDETITSDSNRALTKAHVDLVGSYMERTHSMTHKGVHAEVTRLEAVRIALHTYLVIADILSYLDRSTIAGGPLLPNIHSVTRDEIVALVGVKEAIANEVVKLRARRGQVKLKDLAEIRGVGPKTLERVQSNLSLDYPPPDT